MNKRIDFAKRVSALLACCMLAAACVAGVSGCSCSSDQPTDPQVIDGKDGIEIIIDENDTPLYATGRKLTSSELKEIASEIVSDTNVSRKKNSRAKLKVATRLKSSSKTRSTEIKRKWSHTRPSGKSWITAFSKYGIKTSAAYCGENLAKITIAARPDYSDAVLETYADYIHKSLMNSSGHRKNIVKSKYKYVGISVSQKLSNGRLTIYVCEHFSSRYH